MSNNWELDALEEDSEDTLLCTPTGKGHKPLQFQKKRKWATKNLGSKRISVFQGFSATPQRINTPETRREHRIRSKTRKPNGSPSLVQVLAAERPLSSILRSPIRSIDCGTLLTVEPLEFTLVIFDCLQIKDLLVTAQVCRSWNKCLKEYPRYKLSAGQFVSRWTIFTNLQRRERKNLVTRYLYEQPAITAHMRAVLVDWLVQVNTEFENKLETLFLTVKMVDKFFNDGPPVPRAEVQLVGVACLLIASKLEETHYPDLSELLYLCDGIYTRTQLLDMERIIMSALNHTLNMPTVLTFLYHILQDFELPPPATCLALYLAEQSLLDYELVTVLPSVLAITIYCYVAYHYNLPYANVLETVGIAERDLFDTAVSLYACQRGATKLNLQHIRSRHSSAVTYEVSSISLSDTFLTKLVRDR